MIENKQKRKTPKRGANSEINFEVSQTNPETIATRIRKCADIVGSGDRLAQETAIPRRTLETYLSGAAEPKANRLALIAKAAKVTMDWLATGEGPMRLKHRTPLTIDETPGKYTYIPLYDVHASAGHGAIVDSEMVADDLRFKTEWINNELHVNAADLYLIYVQGDSMEPAMRAGDIILVNRVNQAISADGIYVLQMEGTLLVKRLQRLPGNRIRITSDNPAYQPFEMELAALDADGNALVGRVVWIGRRI